VLLRRPLGEAVHPGLGSGVGAAREERRDAGDVDDAAATTLDHAAERRVGEPQDSPHQDVLLGLLHVDRVVEEPVLEPEARVVDQQVHRA
jgi:hypothetical protein